MNGIWRTVGGRRIFIKEGQDLATAMKESGKFNNKKEPSDEELLAMYRGLKKGWELEKEYKKEYNKFVKQNAGVLNTYEKIYDKLEELRAEKMAYKNNLLKSDFDRSNMSEKLNKFEAQIKALEFGLKNSGLKKLD